MSFSYGVYDLIKYCFFGAPKNALKWRLCPLSDWNPTSSDTEQTQAKEDNIFNTFKISVVGETLTGSTSICKRFVHDEINVEAVSSMGPDCWAKEVNVENQIVNLQIWNIRGFGYSPGKAEISLERDWKPIKEYVCKRAHVVILVFDVTSAKTFLNVPKYLEYLDLDNRVIKILVGNKIDLKEKKVVSTEDATHFAEKNDMRFFETSAVKNLNIDEMFDIISKTLLKSKNG